MSNVIKVENVIFDTQSVRCLKEKPTPKPKIEPDEKQDAQKEKETLRKREEEIALEREKLQSVLENESEKFKQAVKTSNEISRRGEIESKLAFEDGFREGIKKAQIDGSKIGSTEGNKIAKEELKTVIDKTLNTINSLNSQITDTNREIKTDCINFAFGLAENILGIHINHDKLVYNDLTSDFLATDKENVTMTIDGTPYVIETLQTQALLKAVDGLQGIFAFTNDKSVETKPNESVNEELTEKDQLHLEDETTDSYIDEQKTTEPLETLVKEPEIQEHNESGSFEKEQDKVVVTPFVPQELKEETSKEIENEIESMKKKVSRFTFENFDDEGSDKDDSVNFQNQNDETLIQQDSDSDTGETDSSQEEKFVFFNPINRKSKLSSNNSEELTLEDLADYNKEELKTILKKISPNDIATSLSKASERVVKALTDTLTLKNKNKVIEALKYLGPVSDNEVKAATKKITDMAKEI